MRRFLLSCQISAIISTMLAALVPYTRACCTCTRVRERARKHGRKDASACARAHTHARTQAHGHLFINTVHGVQQQTGTQASSVRGALPPAGPPYQ